MKRSGLLTCTISQLVTMAMNEGGRKHSVFDTNKLSHEGFCSALYLTHTLCTYERHVQAGNCKHENIHMSIAHTNIH